ncbi:hypothetical protein ACIA71_01470 [Streptomyces anulatus]
MTVPKAPKAPQEYCWVITMGWTASDGTTRSRTGVGVITPGTSATRENLTNDVIANARKAEGLGANEGAVLFLSLEPNHINRHHKES